MSKLPEPLADLSNVGFGSLSTKDRARNRLANLRSKFAVDLVAID